MSRKTGAPSYTRPVPTAAARTRGQVARVLAGLALALAIGVIAGMEIAAPSKSDAAIADFRQAEATRDLAQIRELTTLARDTKQAVEPVLTALGAATGPARQPVTDQQLQQWRQTIKQRLDLHFVSVSGTTATNVARGGLRTAVTMLATTLDTYSAARALPAAQQGPFLDLADRQRREMVTAWSVAATQLDQLNVWAGNGHQHVYLTDNPQGGAMTPDGAPEGGR